MKQSYPKAPDNGLDREIIEIHSRTSSTICPLPFMSFYGTASGDIVACCESQDAVLSLQNEDLSGVWNNEVYKELRRALIDGERPEVCQKCWKNEDEGLKSNRMQALDDLNEGLYGYNVIPGCHNDGSVNRLPTFVELKASNVCNLKCRMCHADSSHRVLEDIEIIRKYRYGFPERKSPLKADALIEQLKDNINELSATLKIIQYSGGEPLISREQFELTTLIGEKFGEKVQLRYSTNLNNLIFEKYDVIELWKKFKHVHVKISIDGIFDVYDYVRVGGKFDTLVRNLERLKKVNLPNIDIAIGFTTQAYNVYQLPEFLDFFTAYIDRPRISTHLLYTPQFMCVDSMPQDLRHKIAQKLRLSPWGLEPIANYLERVEETEKTKKMWNRLLNYTNDMEAKYGIKDGYQSLLQKYL